HAAAGKAQLAAGHGAFGYFHFDRAAQGGNLDRRAQGGFPGRQGQVDIQVSAADAIQAMRLELHGYIEIARASAVQAGAALLGQAQALAVGGSLGYAYAIGLGAAARHALFVVVGQREAQVGLGAGVDLLEGDRHVHFEILAIDGTARALLMLGTLRGRESGQEVGEVDVREIGRFFMVVLLPLVGRDKVFALWMAAQVVVGGSFIRVFEGAVGFGHFLEFLFSARLFGHVGVILVGQLAIGLFYFVLGGVAGHAKDFVVIDVFHADSRRVCRQITNNKKHCKAYVRSGPAFVLP